MTPDFGDCGCDNCKGAFEDISTRMDEYTDRRFIQGWEHSKSIWTVPQGFGASEYWSRVPTGPEFVVENALAINHGARGSVSWSAPAPADVTAAGAGLSSAIKTTLKEYVLSPSARFAHVTLLPAPWPADVITIAPGFSPPRAISTPVRRMRYASEAAEPELSPTSTPR